jgi:hypothetical protein
MTKMGTVCRIRDSQAVIRLTTCDMMSESSSKEGEDVPWRICNPSTVRDPFGKDRGRKHEKNLSCYDFDLLPPRRFSYACFAFAQTHFPLRQVSGRPPKHKTSQRQDAEASCKGIK